MRIEPSGVIMIGECEIQTSVCTALEPAPITAVWGSPGRHQIDVCRPCLEEMVRLGEWEIRGAKIPSRYNIAVYDKAKRLQLVVEVKKHPYEVTTRLEDWVRRIRRNLVIHSAIPSSVYFLLAIYPAPFYLWGKEDVPEAIPRFKFDVQTELPRLHGSMIANEYQQQEDAISSWLTALINIPSNPEGETDRRAWLYDSGLYKAIQGGTIVRQSDRGAVKEPQAA